MRNATKPSPSADANLIALIRLSQALEQAKKGR